MLPIVPELEIPLETPPPEELIVPELRIVTMVPKLLIPVAAQPKALIVPELVMVLMVLMVPELEIPTAPEPIRLIAPELPMVLIVPELKMP